MSSRMRRVLGGLGGALVLVIVVAVAGLGSVAGAATKKKACNKSNPVKIGEVIDLSGFGAGIAGASHDGINIGVADINKKGGVLGRCITMVTADTGTDVTKAAQAARQVVADTSIKFGIAPTFSGPAGVTLPIYNQAGVLSSTGSSYVDSGTPSKFPLSFHPEFTTDAQVGAMIPFLKKRKITKVALMLPNSANGVALNDSTKRYMARNNITITATQILNTGLPDVTPQMSRLKDSGAQAVLIFMSTDSDQIAEIKAIQALSWNVPAIGQSSITNSGTVKTFQPSQLANVYSTGLYKGIMYKSNKVNGGQANNPAARPFVKTYLKALQGSSKTVGMQQATGGYDQIHLIAFGINGAKSLDPQKVKAYLEKHPFNGIRGKYRFSSRTHNGVPSASLGLVKVTSENKYKLFQEAK